MENINSDPYDIFYNWYLPVVNSENEYSNAVVLSTSSRSGKVSSRIVLLKEYDREGFIFFTNYESRKGRQLEENHYASLLFFWPDTMRQVRIEGAVEKTSGAESDEYFNSRIKGHKINALVSSQSRPVKDINLLRQKRESAMAFYRDKEPERPHYWGGYRLVPDRFEFWEEGEHRFHHRREFLYNGEEWDSRVLFP